MTLLSFSVLKRNATNFFKNLILYTHLWFLLTKKKIIIHCCFLICWSKNLAKSLLLQFIENPYLRDNIHAGIYSEQKRRKLILLALLFTGFLKFALLKNSQVKSTTSKTEWIPRKSHNFGN